MSKILLHVWQTVKTLIRCRTLWSAASDLGLQFANAYLSQNLRVITGLVDDQSVLQSDDWPWNSGRFPTLVFTVCLKKPMGIALVIQGPFVQSVVSLTSSLSVISLTVLADSIYSILIFFCWKNESSFCAAKATHIFSAKNFSIFAYHSM